MSVIPTGVLTCDEAMIGKATDNLKTGISIGSRIMHMTRQWWLRISKCSNN